VVLLFVLAACVGYEDALDHVLEANPPAYDAVEENINEDVTSYTVPTADTTFIIADTVDLVPMSTPIPVMDDDSDELVLNRKLEMYVSDVACNERPYISTEYTINLFVEPLLAWFADGVDVPEWWGDVASTRAFWVDVDGNSTLGVLAIKHIAPYDAPVSVGRIFYLYNDMLLYKDIGFVEGFPAVVTTENGRPILVGGDAGTRYYILFGIENGHLVYSLTLIREPQQDYYIFHISTQYGSWLPITEAEFNALRIKYGLDNIRGTWRTDDMDSILSA
jgi:hypothetical protein